MEDPSDLSDLPDDTLLERLLAALHAIEAAHVAGNDDALRGAQSAARDFARRISSIDALRDFSALPTIATMLSGELDARAITSMLVPVERALDKKLRDEDFLIAADDWSRDVRTMPLRLVADSLRSSFNVGGLFRTGECFGIEELVLCGYSADPSDARVCKATLGTHEHVVWRRERRVEDALASCRAEARLTVALESDASYPALEEVDISWPCALFVGNERHGLTTSFCERVDVRARIPLFGRKNSLNVVSATAIALEHLRRRFEAR
ncbi:MAG: hypothetical protein H6832_11545 [Planctomycetes bacterium]|nr:hypothetical protein [Planctomycetota bacterium]MCB9919025.1 hypothetical protein [Planctomycetota bacterium]